MNAVLPMHGLSSLIKHREFSTPPQFITPDRPREIVYINDSGTYSFVGWKSGDNPSETFRKQDYAGCLHGIMFALLLLADPYLSHRAIEDDGVLHEVVHIMHIGLNPSEELVAQLEELENKALAKYEELLAEQNRTGTRPTYDFRVKRTKQSELKAASQVQQKEIYGSKEFLRYFDPSGVRAFESLHQPMLSSVGQEDAVSSSTYGEAGRSDDVR
jgi:hypothetical protein